MVYATIALGVVALVVPWITEVIKRHLFGPKLVAVFREGNPYNHLTHTTDPTIKLYYFRFGVKNEGSGTAENAEVEIESIKKEDVSHRLAPLAYWAPAGLKWSSRQAERVNILPGQTVIADFFKIAKSVDAIERLTNATPTGVLRLEVQREVYAQPPELRPATYEITLVIYCANASPRRYTVKLTFNGIWHEEEQEMFAACVVEPKAESVVLDIAVRVAGATARSMLPFGVGKIKWKD